jgi:hypothetical protein
MTPIGHSLTGAALGLVAMPRHAGPRHKAILLGSFVVLANLPDATLPGWGHYRYDISHSVFVNLAIVAAAATAILLWPRARRAVGGVRVVLLGAAAWLSHLLMDCCYNHGNGAAIFWPVSSARLNLPVPWFSPLYGPWPYLNAHDLRLMGVELAFFGALFLIVWSIRRAVLARRP